MAGEWYLVGFFVLMLPGVVCLYQDLVRQYPALFRRIANGCGCTGCHHHHHSKIRKQKRKISKEISLNEGIGIRIIEDEDEEEENMMDGVGVGDNDNDSDNLTMMGDKTSSTTTTGSNSWIANIFLWNRIKRKKEVNNNSSNNNSNSNSNSNSNNNNNMREEFLEVNIENSSQTIENYTLMKEHKEEEEENGNKKKKDVEMEMEMEMEMQTKDEESDETIEKSMNHHHLSKEEGDNKSLRQTLLRASSLASSSSSLSLQQLSIQENTSSEPLSLTISSSLSSIVPTLTASINQERKKDDLRKIDSNNLYYTYHYTYSILCDWKNILLWNGTLLFCYIYLRTLVVLLGFRRNNKGIIDNMNDMVEFLIRGLVIYVCGNLAHRLDTANQIRYKFIMGINAYVLMYAITFQLCPENIQLSNQSKMSWSFVLIIMVAVITNIYVVVRNIQAHWYISPMYTTVKWLYFGGALLLVLFHIALFAIGQSRIHIHHHWWSFLLALFTRCTAKTNIAMQCLCIGIWIHGGCVFGFETWLTQ